MHGISNIVIDGPEIDQSEQSILAGEIHDEDLEAAAGGGTLQNSTKGATFIPFYLCC